MSKPLASEFQTTPTVGLAPRTALFGLQAAGLLVSLLAGCVETEEPTYATTASMVTVGSTVSTSCSTAVVIGLSKQIADEVSCLNPAALTRFTPGGRITFTGNAVLPYLGAPAKAGLMTASSAASIQINSAYRTVAQQYLIYRWYQQGRCGIDIAARPGRSNHQSGRALDIASAGSKVSAMRRGGWSWAGSSDPVHFDHRGSADIRGQDVLAFQRLWNRNHPSDRIAEDGDYGPDTETRLKQAPATGFAQGASCATRSFGAGDAADVLAVDGPDKVAPGAHATYSITLKNAGTTDWPATTRLVVKDGVPSVLHDASSWASTTDLGPINVAIPAGGTGVVDVEIETPMVTELTPVFTELTLSDGTDTLGLVPIAVTITPNGDEGTSTEGDDMHDDEGEEGADVSGGCAAGGGSAGLGLLAPLLALVRRRRRV